MDDEEVLTGKVREKHIPLDWIGEPLPNGEGWRWSDPKNRKNAVRIHRGDPSASDPVDRSTYVIVTVNGEMLDAKGHKTGEFLND